MKETTLSGLRCMVREPSGFSPEGRYPVLLCLHGAGTRGNDMEPLRQNSFFTISPPAYREAFYCVAPLCTENSWFDLWEHLLALVKELSSLPWADPRRLYVMGASMGGYATWQLGMSLPSYIAAIVPICGGGMYWNAARLADVPVWAFHGAKDTTVLPEESEKMVEKVLRRGGRARLTLYPDNAHDAWSDTYSNPRVYAWLLEQVKGESAPQSDGYDDPKRFG